MYRKPEWVQYMEDMKEALKGNYDLVPVTSPLKISISIEPNEYSHSSFTYPPYIPMTVLVSKCFYLFLCLFGCHWAMYKHATNWVFSFCVCTNYSTNKPQTIQLQTTAKMSWPSFCPWKRTAAVVAQAITKGNVRNPLQLTRSYNKMKNMCACMCVQFVTRSSCQIIRWKWATEQTKVRQTTPVYSIFESSSIKYRFYLCFLTTNWICHRLETFSRLRYAIVFAGDQGFACHAWREGILWVSFCWQPQTR